MMMPSTNEQPARRYLRAPRAIHFPTEAEVPETKRHLEIRTALYAILKLALGDRALIGSDQFVYWDPTDPSECLAPDAFVRLGAPDELFDSWKVWERGAPHVAVEIVSGSDASEAVWAPKLQKYHRLGVCEVVRFDPEAGELRIWDLVTGDLVERALVEGQPAECVPLGLFWVLRPDEESEVWLRLARDRGGANLLPTSEELAATARDERDAALERVRLLEEELAERRGRSHDSSFARRFRRALSSRVE
jgi:Uma2 family endonuclease